MWPSGFAPRTCGSWVFGVKMEQETPKPLGYAKPSPPRSFQDALTDYVRQETEAGRVPRAVPRWHRTVLFLLIVLAVAAVVASILLRIARKT